jgi:hypothetical protein
MGACSVRRWVKHFTDGNTDIADQPRCDEPRTAATERKKQKVELITQDRRISQRNCSAAWSGHHAVEETMEISVYRKVYSHSVLRLLTGTEEHKTAGNCSLLHPSPDFVPSDYHLFMPLKYHLRGHH